MKKQVKMNRPYSPTTVMTEEIPVRISNLLDAEQFHFAADQGFTYVINKLNKPSITAGDIMLEFYNCVRILNFLVSVCTSEILPGCLPVGSIK